MHDVVLVRLQPAELPAVPQRSILRRGVGQEKIDLLLPADRRNALVAIELNRTALLRPQLGRRVVGQQRQRIHVRRFSQAVGVDEEEELALHVVGIVQGQGVLLDEGLAPADPGVS